MNQVFNYLYNSSFYINNRHYSLNAHAFMVVKVTTSLSPKINVFELIENTLLLENICQIMQYLPISIMISYLKRLFPKYHKI